MRGLLCFGIDSYWRLMSKRWRLFLLRNCQLRPDVLPVVGAQILAGDLSVGFALDAHAYDDLQKLPDGNRLAQVADSGATALRKRRLLSHGQAVQVFQKESHD